MAILLITYLGMVYMLPIHSWTNLIILSGIMAIIGFGLGLLFVLNSSEREKIFRILNNLKIKL